MWALFFAAMFRLVNASMPAKPARAPQPVAAIAGLIVGSVRGASAEELAKTSVEARTKTNRFFGKIDSTTGAFQIEGVPDGEATVLAVIGENFLHANAKRVEVRDGFGGPVDIDIAAGFKISGRVTYRGSPVDGTINFKSEDNPTPLPRFTSVRNGRYEIERISGKCVIGFKTQSGVTAHRGEAVFDGDATYDIEIEGATLRGQVLDANSGQPLDDASLTIRAMRHYHHDTQTTQRDGTFAFDYLADGRYRVRVQRNGYAPEEFQADIAGGQIATRDFRLQPAMPLVIHVHDAVTNRPVFATVMIGEQGGQFLLDGKSNDGVFRTWLRPGNYVARVEAQGYTIERALQITVPGPEVRVRLGVGGTLIVKSRGRTSFQAWLVTAAGERIAHVQERNPHIAPGTYIVRILHDGVRPESEQLVSIVEGQITTVEID